MIRRLKNQSGATLIELVISAAILALSAQALMVTMDYINHQYRRVKLLTTEDRQIYSLLSSIRHNLSKFQVDSVPVGANVEVDENGNLLDSNDAPDNARTLEFSEYRLRDLPIAWSDYSMTTVDECAECPGRMGYVIQPYSSNPGMYRVKVKVTNPVLYGAGSKYYEFSVNIQ